MTATIKSTACAVLASVSFALSLAHDDAYRLFDTGFVLTSNICG